MIITYTHDFVSTCPANGKAIYYTLTIESLKEIRVEEIVIACALEREGYHETIAKRLYCRFRQRQTLIAHHHGVDIKTVAGTPEAV